MIPPRDSIAPRALSSRPSGRGVAKQNTYRRGTQKSDSRTRRNGTGQLPACDSTGWLKIEAQGCGKGNNGPAHTIYPQGGEAAFLPTSGPPGEGGLSGEVMQWPCVPFSLGMHENTPERRAGEKSALRETPEGTP